MRLYTPIWSIKDPGEMLIAIGKLEKSGIDYTLLAQEIIGVRPKDLFRTMKISGVRSKEVTDRNLYMENGKPVSGISIKSLDVAGDSYRMVIYIQGVGNITASTLDPEAHDPKLLILPYSAKKEEILYEYAGFLGF